MTQTRPGYEQDRALTELFKVIAKNWERIAGPPYRPSSSGMSIYARWLQKLAHGDGWQALVFGATPELRDLTLRLGAHTTAVDISAHMLQALTLLMEEDRTNERIHNANWLSTGLEDSSFDIAVGDSHLNMLALEQIEPALREVYRVLKPGGYFVMTFTTSVPRDRVVPLEQVVREYEDGRTTMGDFIIKIAAVAYDPVTKSTDFAVLLPQIDALHQAGGVSDKTMQELRPYRGTDDIKILYMSEVELEAVVLPFFEIETKEYPTGYWVCQHQPVYVLRSRKKD